MFILTPLSLMLYCYFELLISYILNLLSIIYLISTLFSFSLKYARDNSLTGELCIRIIAIVHSSLLLAES